MPNVVPGLALLLTVACTGVIDGSSAPGQGSSRPSASGGSGGGAVMTAECASDQAGPRVLRPLTRLEYANTLTDLLGLVAPDIAPVPADVEERGFTNNVTVATMSEARLSGYWTVAQALAERAVTEAYASLVPCAAHDSACADQFIDTFGQRALRRPLTAAEREGYRASFSPELSGGKFEVGVQLTIQRMLMSPSFLLRSELGEQTSGGSFRLTPHEMASALSYLYWGTMPDQELLTKATAGELIDKVSIEQQARRLLADPRGRLRIADFFYEWLEAPKAYVASKDPDTYGKLFDAEDRLDLIRDSMRAEQDAFVTHVALDSTRTFGELFNSRTSFLDDRLAHYYGLTAPGSSQVVPVDLQGSERGGLLTLGMVLFGHSHPASSSPTQRGHFIRGHLFCEDIPPPPMNVDVAAELQTDVAGLTARQRILKITDRAQCKGCHDLMDPLGFGLEAFDGAGAFRTQDLGRPIDATGLVSGIGAAAPSKFDGAQQLSRLVAESPVAQACFATNYFRFARGFNPYPAERAGDACSADELSAAFIAGGLDVSELFVAVALQNSFSMRSNREVLDK